MFCEKICRMIIWFWYQIIAFSFYCEKFNIYVFYYIFHSFFKNCISYQLKKNIFKVIFFLRPTLISIYGFSQAFWLILIKTNPWFNVCFKFILCITYSDFSSKLQAFKMSFLCGKSAKSLRCSCTAAEYTEHQLLTNIHHHFFLYRYL